ncbi:hypothetical protein N7449_011409 [Penicillium cf. viridicatum]|uniref:Uncharacterized protein n=1 Tax=Penicillium cf. viridicatum TaxID=2972119 RepID=A0A9W9J1E8_9EURO|nr:hypothetical protein N7449_011409 [Penicillium cf. viridicatum]
MSGNTSIPKGLKPWYKELEIPDQLPCLEPNDMTVHQAKLSFGIKPAHGYRLWQFPNAIISLPLEFVHCLQKYDRPTTKSRCRIDALIMAVYHALDSQGFIHTPTRVKIDFDTLEWSPITYNNTPYSYIGKADFTLSIGEKDHMTCYLVVVKEDAQLSARQAESRPHRNKRGQLLAYMAMVQASRKRRHQSDYTVWGFLSDGLDYWFYQLDMQGEWSLVIFQSTREGWQSIANIFATFMLHSTASYPPLRPNLA